MTWHPSARTSRNQQKYQAGISKQSKSSGGNLSPVELGPAAQGLTLPVEVHMGKSKSSRSTAIVVEGSTAQMEEGGFELMQSDDGERAVLVLKADHRRQIELQK